MSVEKIDIREKTVFNYILDNVYLFAKVPSHYFKNEYISFIYKVLRNYMLENKLRLIPSNIQIFDMVMVKDKKGIINEDIFKTIFDINLAGYKDDYLSKEYSTWFTFNQIDENWMEGINQIREADVTDSKSIDALFKQIKDLALKATKIEATNLDLGLDFDNPEHHRQPDESSKIPSRHKLMNELMGGGFELKGLHAFIGEPNIGKSLILENFAVDAVDMGKNVAFVSLEMSDTSQMKRMGSMRLNIPIADYNELSKDTHFMKEALNRMRATDDVFNIKKGKLFIKEFPTASVNAGDLEGYIQALEQTHNIKIDILVLDYINLMLDLRASKGGDIMYQKIKNISEDLRGLAVRNDMAVLTASQVNSDGFNNLEITMKNISESKGLAHTCDNIWAIIQDPQMYANKQYILKALKLRNNAGKHTKLLFDLDVRYLKIHEQKIIDKL